MKRYNPKELEPKWQKIWADKKLYKAVDFDAARPKYVMLTEFPYPSGDGLHLGHVREYTLGDIMARYKRMTGHNVLYPMGYDAFGLPTENYAIKNKIAPQVATDQNVGNFQKQFDSLGYSIDWDRSFRTTDPSYYKWTQWLFLQFFKAGLAYQAETTINWCPKCKTGLANEEVINGRHERCDTLVEKKTLKQWLLKITEYADRLIDGLQDVDYPSRIADQQINWIGRSKGAEVDFKIVLSDDHSSDERKEEAKSGPSGTEEYSEGSTGASDAAIAESGAGIFGSAGKQADTAMSVRVFTTRPDTLYGATFMVLAPEHSLVEKITTPEQKAAVSAYVKAAQTKSEIERQNTDREKTGVFTGAYAENPVNGEKIPIWIADYVLAGYGTGAIMAVPAHDERDFEFAKKFNLPIKQVIAPYITDSGKNAARDDVETLERQVVDVIIKNDQDEYLLLVEEDNVHFVGGGIEPEDKNEQDAVRREVEEETGYTDISLIKQVSCRVITFAYRIPKQKNQLTDGMFYEVTLGSDKQVKSEVDDGKHKIIWVKKDEVANLITWEAHSFAWQQYLSGNGCCASEGKTINSDQYNGMNSSEMREKIVKDLEAKGLGKEKTTYKLRDWIFSRQHYWGEPIPIIHCQKCGAVPVPDNQLPVELPPADHYEPTDTGESPLALITDWVNVDCPQCSGKAKRETDTMPNWAGSSWYYLRYFDARNDKEFADKKKLEYWGMVDMYLGGMEHTTLHLLYSRFWHQFFYDQGLVPTSEPYYSRRGQGIILAADGTKMSKSKGNVTNPTDIIDSGYGADALRTSIAFIAPYDQTTPWSPEGVAGTHRFVARIWTLVQEYLSADKQGSGEASKDLLVATHKTIAKVSSDLHTMNFNTAVAALMEFVNSLYKIKSQDNFASNSWGETIKILLQLTAPFASHVTEELWQQIGQQGSVHVSEWPVHDKKYLTSDNITIVVQVNGKVRANVDMLSDSDKEAIILAAQNDQKVTGYLKDKEIRKTIYVPHKLVNFVVV